jgi:hypothetical protein
MIIVLGAGEEKKIGGAANLERRTKVDAFGATAA